MRHFRSRIVSSLVAIAIVSSSTASIAATPAQATASQARDPWVTLSMLTPVGSSAMTGTAVAAAQSDAVPPPEARGGFNVPLPVIAIWLADIALIIYLATKHHHGHVIVPNPGSPT